LKQPQLLVQSSTVERKEVMDSTTFEPIAAIIQNTRSLSAKARRTYISALQHDPAELEKKLNTQPPEKQVTCNRISFHEASRLGGCSIRALQNLCAEGSLSRVFLPGRKRAFGVKRDQFLALFGGAE